MRGQLKKKAHAAVVAWAEELHAFVETAGATLLRDGMGDMTWLETGLRDASDRACRDIVEGLLAMPGLHVAGDTRRDGERRVAGVKRNIHTLFGDVSVTRNWYKACGIEGRFPMDVALGLVDGHTPALAGLICRDAANQPFTHAQEDFKAHTGRAVDARQFQRLALRVGREVEDFLRADHGPGNDKPPRVYVQVDGTGAPLRHKELKGRKGKGPDGKAQTHEVKVAALFTEHPQVFYTSFGSPYLLYELPHIPNLVAAYGGADVSQRAAVKVWLGEMAAQGVLPVTLPKIRVKPLAG